MTSLLPWVLGRLRRVRPGPHDVAAVLLLLVAWLRYVLQAAPEVLHAVPDLNDDVLHRLLAHEVSAALAAGKDPTDPWVSAISGGYPVLHHYQHLPALALGALAWLLGGANGGRALELELLRASTLGLLALLPLAVAFFTHRLGGGAKGAALAGVATTFLGADGLYGLEPASFGWAGYGLTTQLWGAVLMCVALGLCCDALAGRPRLAAAGAALALLGVTHAALGWVGAATAGLLCLAPLLQGPPTGRAGAGLGGGPQPRLRAAARAVAGRAGRLVLVSVVAVVGASYFVVSFLVDGAAMNHSVWEPAAKVDGRGAAWTLAALVRGELLDGRGGLPVLTALLGVALAAAFVGRGRWVLPRAPARRAAAALFAVWLLAYFGRPTWGRLVDLVPLAGDLHLHRLIVPVQLGALAAVGATLGAAWERFAARWPRPPAALLAAAAIAVLLASPLAARSADAARRRSWVAADQAALLEDGGDLEAVLSLLRDEQGRAGGRAYAGPPRGWGAKYRVGSVPVFARLTAEAIDNVGYLYHALAPTAELQGYFDETRPAHRDLFDVRWLLAPLTRRPPADARLVLRRGGHALYQVASAGPLRLVDGTGPWAGDHRAWLDAMRRWLASPDVDARQHPLLWVDRPAPDGAQPLTAWRPGAVPGPPCGTVDSLQRRPAAVTASLTAARACYALLSATYHPGWRARLDGASVATVMLAPSFVGVAVPPGRHHLELEYAPPWFRRPLAAGGWLGVLAALLFERWRWGATRYPGKALCADVD